MAAERLTGSSSFGRLLWAFGLMLMLFYLFLTVDGTMSQVKGGDGPSYLVLAESLATGHGYSDINVPGAPPHTQYPPVLPLVLAMVYAPWGHNFMLMKLVMLAFSVAAVFAVRAFFAAGSGDRLYATLIAVLTGTNFYFLFFTNEIMADIPYAFFSFAALLYAQGRIDGGRGRGALLVVLPVLLALAYFTRMIGVTLVAAAFAATLFGGHSGARRGGSVKMAVVLALLAAAPFVVWSVRGSLNDSGVATYQSILTQADYYAADKGSIGLATLAQRVSENASYYYDGVARTIITFAPVKDALAWPVFLVVFVVVTLGFLRELAVKRGMKDFYCLFYAALLLVWPVYGSGDARRYLVPLVPFIYHYLLSGAAWLASLARTAPWRAMPAGVIAIGAVFLALNAIEIVDRSLEKEDGFDVLRRASEGRLFAEVRRPGLPDIGVWRFERQVPCYFNYLVAAGRLKDFVHDGGLVAARKPELIYLVTGSPVVRFPFTADAQGMKGFLEARKVSHVLLDACYEETDTYMRSYVRSAPEGFQVLLSDNKGTAVLKLQ